MRGWWRNTTSSEGCTVDGREPGSSSRMMRLASLACRLLAVAYPIALAVVIVCLRLIRERWWGTAAGVDFPRWLFAPPLGALPAARVSLAPRPFRLTQLPSP